MKLKNSICVTGAAGFIGFHLSRLLLEKNIPVIGVDALTDYYDVSLKHDRLKILQNYDHFTFLNDRIENIQAHQNLLGEANTTVIVHLAAQAGVRYSIENPSEYVSTNLVGTASLLELAKNLNIDHFLAASTSSVYGANTEMPFKETDKCDTQMSFYAATKKANEAMAHSYSHIFDLPVTMFRFFTVYGPWGRPDMALFKFAKKMLTDEAIDVYNHGKMTRDFTYVADLVKAISLLIESIPERDNPLGNCDSLSPVAPFRVVNIGNSEPTPLMDYIHILEQCLGIRARKNFLEMQPGDVPATSSNCKLLNKLTGYSPSTHVSTGRSRVRKMVHGVSSEMKIPKLQTIKLIFSLRKSPISSCVNIFGVKFDHSHHLVKTVLQINSQPSINFKDTELYAYHKNFCPISTNEALNLNTLERTYQTFHYPWGQFNKFRKMGKNVLTSRFCGPTSDEDIFLEFVKLKSLLHDISNNGYRPVRNRSIIFGTRIIKNKTKMFIPMQGNHRISVLAALNFHGIYAGQHPKYHQDIKYFENPVNTIQRDHNKVLDRFFNQCT